MKNFNIVIGLEELKCLIHMQYPDGIDSDIFRELCEIGFQAYCESLEWDVFQDPGEIVLVRLGDWIIEREVDCETLTRSIWYDVVVTSFITYEEILEYNDILINERYICPTVQRWLGDSMMINCIKV